MDDKLVVGLMSGTSVDGIDAALVRIIEDQEGIETELVEFASLDFDQQMRQEILVCCDPKQGTVDRVCNLNFRLAELFAAAIEKVAAKADIPLEKIDLIGSHGQTIYHSVESKDNLSTLQVGTGAVIAQQTGITTVSDFRVRDVAAGGEGAPLVPYIDYLLYSDSRKSRVLQNIGGIGNYTYLPAGGSLEEVEGSDTGPGNMLIDGVVTILTDGQENFDRDGQWASQGEVSSEILTRLMEEPVILKDAPKSTGREVFGADFARKIIERGRQAGLSEADIVATVTAFSAKSIVDAYRRFISGPIDQVIISGGGSYNPTLVEMIKAYCRQLLHTDITVMIQEDMNQSSDAKEGIAFALLAYQSMKGRANNVPQVTGASEPVVLGQITPGNNFYNYLNW